MLNRRHLRIKVLQALYAYFQSNEENYRKTENELLQAVERMYDLYIYLLLTFSELKSIAEFRIEENKKKIRPSKEDLQPNLKLIDNQLIAMLESNIVLRKLSEDRKVNWVGDEHREMFRKMFLQLKDSETYLDHMNNGEVGFEADKLMAIELFKVEIANFPLLYNFFEEKSIHWLDDIDLACSMVLKTIKSAEEEKSLEILPLYKIDDDEQDFIKDLLRKTISMDKENELLIDELTDNWELDRIAKMDIILMKMAITEMQIFSNIPTKVTLNEYIEISKFYSTPKSNSFINGILDKAIDRLKKDKKIVKIGRGLMD
ncbi:MAG: transcription antitermination protein NusB [Flavobacteriia bacterium]|jgi:N utilization substance protein B